MIAERQFCKNSNTTTATEHFANRLARVRGGVETDYVVEALWKAFFEFIQLGNDPFAHIQRIGVRHLEDCQEYGRFPVQADIQIEILGVHGDAADIFDQKFTPVRISSQNDVLELLGFTQPAQRGQRNLRRLAVLDRLLAEGTGRRWGVLFPDRGHDFRGRHAAGGHLGRIQPNAHAVIALAE
jgi:hypothetical protein